VRLEPCTTGGRDRASDEGALDILTILKEASGQGPNRAGQPTHAVATSPGDGPSFTSEEMALIYRDSKLKAALPRCAWQVRQVLDSLLHGVQTGQPVRPCRTGSESSRGSDEGALDILKILREASGESTNN
jgi:hypothetical protein